MVNGGHPLGRRLNTQLPYLLSKTTMKTNFLFSAVGIAPILSFLSLSALCDVDGAEVKKREREWDSRGRGRNFRRNDNDGMWRTSPPNPDASNSLLQNRLHPHRCVRDTNTPGAWSAKPPNRDVERICVTPAAGSRT